jgi:hypothetical protein
MAKKNTTKREAADSTIEEAVLPAQPAKQPEKELSDNERFPHQDALAELRAEILTITQGEDPAKIVWRARKSNGKEVGVSLGYYDACKQNEIKTGTPCEFVELIGQPVPTSLAAGNLGSPIKKMKVKKCAPC